MLRGLLVTAIFFIFSVRNVGQGATLLVLFGVNMTSKVQLRVIFGLSRLS